MTVGFWSPTGTVLPPRPEWRTVTTLSGPPPDRLVVLESEWESFVAELEAGAPPPPSVILLLNVGDAPPAAIDQDVDAIVLATDAQGIESALRVTDTELADLIAGLSDDDLTDLLLPPNDPATLAGRTLQEADLERALRLAFYETRHRALVTDPLRRALTVEAPLSPAPNSAAEMIAAVALVALLRAGMRATSRTQYRSDPTDDALPHEQDVADALSADQQLEAEIPGAPITFRLDEDQLIVTAPVPIEVRIIREGQEPWVRAGSEVAVPTPLLSGPTEAVFRIAASGRRDGS
jgi:hypothetical protein